jgi:CheY-like chemotaxis protein
MPENDGFEAIDRFRSRFPATKIIAISGDAKRARLEYLPVAALMGVDATLKKPFDTGQLLRVLQSLEPGEPVSNGEQGEKR